MKQVIYRSQPFGFDNAILAGILSQARRNNRENDITGALICRQDMYIQLVEGPEPAIDALVQRISADDRHLNVKLVLSREIEERMFPFWAMLDDQVPSMTWSREEISDGALDSATPEMLDAVFERIAAKARESEPPD
ncbi:MAG: BLUF domain-containing protein [Pseudomonadota bacterium]